MGRADADKDVRQGFLENLLNLEINTITRQGMTGRKMPAPAVALVEIGEVYTVALLTPSAERNVTTALAPPPEVTAENKPSAETFERLAHAARDSSTSGNPTREDFDDGGGSTEDAGVTGGIAGSTGAGLVTTSRASSMARTPAPATGAEAVICRRIAGNSERLREMLSREDVKLALEGWSPAPGAPVPPLPLTPEEVVLVRKIWELGAEPISIQTVVQADGDILTRLTPRASGPQGGAAREMHLPMVEMSVEFWKNLVDVAMQLLETVFFFRSSGRRGRR